MGEGARVQDVYYIKYICVCQDLSGKSDGNGWCPKSYLRKCLNVFSTCDCVLVLGFWIFT